MGKFQKGKSGNPKGRPAIVREIRQKAQAAAHECIDILLEIARNRNEKATARNVACREILDRGLGKAIQGIELQGAEGGPVQVDLSSLTDEQIRQALELAKVLKKK